MTMYNSVYQCHTLHSHSAAEVTYMTPCQLQKSAAEVLSLAYNGLMHTSRTSGSSYRLMQALRQP